MSIQTTPPITDTDLERRAALIEGLRQIADFYEAHPEMPLPPYPDLALCVRAADDTVGVAEVDRIAQMLGVEAGLDGNYRAKRAFAGVEFKAFYVPREEMRRYAAEASYAGAVQPDEQSGRAA